MAVKTTNPNRLKESSVGTGPISSSRILNHALCPSACRVSEENQWQLSQPSCDFHCGPLKPYQTHMCSQEKHAVSKMTQEKLRDTGSVRIVFIGNLSKSPQFRFYFIDCVSASGFNLVSGHWINRTEAISVPPCHMKCSLLKISLFLGRFSYVLHLTQLVSFLLQPSTHF